MRWSTSSCATPLAPTHRQTLATARLPATAGPPFAFAVSVPAEAIEPRASLSIFATIRDGDRLMFITDARHPVPREGATGLEVRLRFVASAAGDAAPGIVTPVSDAYRCGEDTFRIAFEAVRANVTMPDLSLVTLDRLTTAGEADSTRTFTNGRVTFVQEVDDEKTSRVLFARGRMVPRTCTRVE